MAFLCPLFFGIAAPKKSATALDARVRQFVRNRDFPGAVMIVLHHGKIIFRKSWGETSYGSRQKPDPERSVYDLASVTKAVGTSTSIMHLYDEGRIKLSDTLGKYVAASRKFPLGRLRIDHLLAHRTGLPPYYISNYWLVSKDKWNESSFSPFPTEKFPDPYRGLYLPKGYRSIMLRDLCQLPFRGKPKTVYSDLNYILLSCLVEEVSGKRMDVYLKDWLFDPMGLKSTTFNPLIHGIPAEQIVPTMENPVGRGWVHDLEAGKLAGICGAAGLFSTAFELARIGEMLRQGGTFNGHRYIKSETIKRFAWKLEPGHARGMGWQKPASGRIRKTIAPAVASSTAFGHTGHTGSLLWIDPKKGLTVVFLANVTYPDDSKSNFTQKAGYRTILKLAYGLL